MYMLAMPTLPNTVVLVQPASIHWRRTVVKAHEDPKKRAMVVFEAVPGCPAWFWSADVSLRILSNSGRGTVY